MSNPPLAVAADKAYDSQKVRQQIKDEGALPSSPTAPTPPRKPIAQAHLSAPPQDRKTTSAASRIGDASPPGTTNSPETSLRRGPRRRALYWIKL